MIWPKIGDFLSSHQVWAEKREDFIIIFLIFELVSYLLLFGRTRVKDILNDFFHIFCQSTFPNFFVLLFYPLFCWNFLPLFYLDSSILLWRTLDCVAHMSGSPSSVDSLCYNCQLTWLYLVRQPVYIVLPCCNIFSLILVLKRLRSIHSYVPPTVRRRSAAVPPT